MARRSPGWCVPRLVALAGFVHAGGLFAQDIEPRSYANAPVGINFVVGGFAYTRLGFPLDPAVPLTDPQLNTANAALGYARVLNFRGTTAKVSIAAPYAFLKGSALYNGEPVEREVNGLTDAKLRLSVNLLGAPALDLKGFTAYKQDFILGVSLIVSAPTGQYDDTRLVNIGAHRWTFKSEVGASKALGRWIAELSTAAEVFTVNTEFYGGITREQEAVYSFKGHVVRSFAKGIWASADGTYFTGGASVLNGTQRNDLQSNWRAGATLSLPVNKHHSVKFYASTGVYARTGNNFDLAGIAWQYRWGAGL